MGFLLVFDATVEARHGKHNLGRLGKTFIARIEPRTLNVVARSCNLQASCNRGGFNHLCTQIHFEAIILLQF